MEAIVSVIIGLAVLGFVISMLGIIFRGIGALGWWNIVFILAIIFTSVVPPVGLSILGFYLLGIVAYGVTAEKEEKQKKKEKKKFTSDTKEMTREEILEYRIKELEAREYYYPSTDQ